ncbi:MAG: helicase HerA-like domain-containing protein [Chitinophagales bacterium]
MTDKRANFKQHIEEGYNFEGEHIILGTAILDEEPLEETLIKAPLKSFNRHGLIAGATGTGKTKTIQLITEALSAESVSVLVMDIKGDLSGLAAEGNFHRKILERHDKIGIPFEPTAFPVELLSLSDEKGVKLRATVSEFGPILFSKILTLNETQSSIVSIIFKYCDDNQLPLLDLKDFKKVLAFATNDGKEELQEMYGSISPASAGAILRRIVELEQQGADNFFGEPSFEVDDLMRIGEDGKGMISILRLTDLQDKPKLFSTFMLCLLAEIYAKFPEEGDSGRPKLVVFIDEAHLIFNEASKALLNQIESIVKLIRSKGVGLFFCTQNPTDIPDAVLSQLGMKVQHALRAFTAKDRKNIKLTAENYPLSDYYQTDEMLTSLGIGEAAITVLDEQGRPTPLAATLLRAPRSRMDVLTDTELDALVRKSSIARHYNKEVDRESAYEILTEKLKAAEQMAMQQAAAEEEEKQTKSRRGSNKEEEGMLESLTKNTMVRQIGRTVARELTRSILGVLGFGGRSRRRW